MHKSSIAIAAALTLVFSAIGISATFARGPGGGFGGGGFGGGGAPGFAAPAGGAPMWQGSKPPGFSQGEKIGWQGGSVPPGWSKGKKTGWHGQKIPPGLYGR